MGRDKVSRGVSVPSQHATSVENVLSSTVSCCRAGCVDGLLNVKTNDIPVIHLVRYMKHFDSHLFVEELEKVDWTACTLSDDIDEKWENFRVSFTNVIDKCDPKKEIRVKQTTEPWMDSEILELIKERDRLLHVYKKSNDGQDFSIFSKVRNLVQRKIKRPKQNIFQIR